MPDHPTPSTHHLLQHVTFPKPATLVIWHARRPTTQSPHDPARRLTPEQWVLRTRRACNTCVVKCENPPLPPLSQPNHTVQPPPDGQSHRTTTTVKLRDKESYQADGDNSRRDWAEGRRAGATALSPFLGCVRPIGLLCMGGQPSRSISRDSARGAAPAAGGAF